MEKKNFEVVFLVMNPGYNEMNYQTIERQCKDSECADYSF